MLKEKHSNRALNDTNSLLWHVTTCHHHRLKCPSSTRQSVPDRPPYFTYVLWPDVKLVSTPRPDIHLHPAKRLLRFPSKHDHKLFGSFLRKQTWSSFVPRIKSRDPNRQTASVHCCFYNHYSQ